MRYGLTKAVMGFPGFIELPKEEYENIKLARSRLFEVLFLEEKFDFVIENYFEYETELLASSARYMIFRNQDYDWLHKERNLISRRIINLLTACRLYLDHSIHHVHNIYGKSSLYENDIKYEKSNLYDTHFGYRFMEALRNYVQHRGSPIHSVAFNSRLIDDQDSNVLFTVTPIIKLSALEEDRKLKKVVLEEIRQIGDQHDIKPLMRDYIECLGNVHAKIRNLLQPDITEWEQSMVSALDVFKSTFGPESTQTAIDVVVEKSSGEYVTSATIFMEFIERRKELERKNSGLEDLAARYVSGGVK